MGIKRTVLIIPIDPRKFFKECKKLKSLFFPLYFWPKSFEKCSWDWGDQDLHESNSKLAHNLLVHSTMGNYFAFFEIPDFIFFEQPYCTILDKLVPISKLIKLSWDSNLIQGFVAAPVRCILGLLQVHVIWLYITHHILFPIRN